MVISQPVVLVFMIFFENVYLLLLWLKLAYLTVVQFFKLLRLSNNLAFVGNFQILLLLTKFAFKYNDSNKLNKVFFRYFV